MVQADGAVSALQDSRKRGVETLGGAAWRGNLCSVAFGELP